jgi:hypothetical protein
LTDPRDIPDGKSGDLFASQVAEHIRVVMGVLRNMWFEEQEF